MNCIFEARWKKRSHLHLTVMMTSMLPRVALLYLQLSVSMPPLLRATTAAAHNSRADFMRSVHNLLSVSLLPRVTCDLIWDARTGSGCSGTQHLAHARHIHVQLNCTGKNDMRQGQAKRRRAAGGGGNRQ
jgi:hypothetical protein